ncbi:hypothetical protein KY345_02300 [Candidatus Woesearchaeota archaeon]|nr:hypothetical protein [Candidatus Woesearchaeota archaeon]
MEANFLGYFARGIAFAAALSLAAAGCAKKKNIEEKIESAWRTETYQDSRACTKAETTTKKKYEGERSLELSLDIDENSETNRKGEAFFDFRYMPDGNPSGIMDLSGKTITAKVYCEKGTAGPGNAPSGIQIYLKSVDNGVWYNSYGNWHNIWQEINPNADRRFGSVAEGQWSTVTMNVPSEGADPDFDPKKVALIGIKYALNDLCEGHASGNVYVDDIKVNGKTLFNFE